VEKAIRESCKGVHIYDNQRIGAICASMKDGEDALKRPDLMYESFITRNGKTKKIFNMTEITSPWAWEHSLQRAFEAKHRKYDLVAMTFHQHNP
jgi:hypothetical protein